MNWRVPLIWEGADVYILGGGPSVPKQFNIPDNIVKDVVAGKSEPSIYSPYMSYLHDKHVIGINVAYLIGNWIDMVFFGDNNFFLKNQYGLAAFPNLKVSSSPTANKYNWVKYLSRDTSHPRGISSNPHMVSWNCNSGSAAVSIAANTGAKRIILLGFDMRLSDDNSQHWHDLYKRGKISGDKLHKLPFGKHLVGFDQMAKDAKARDIEIINCSPDSAIKQFRKISLKELCG
jgi:hypothetical protein